MQKQILISAIVILTLMTIVSAYNYQTIYNPFTSKLDYHITSNMSGENLTADFLRGDVSYITGVLANLSCANNKVAKWNSTSALWYCADDETGAPGAGDIEGVLTDGNYLTGGCTVGTCSLLLDDSVLNATIDDRDQDTTYTNGTGLSLTGTIFSVTLSYFTDRFLELTDTFGGDVSGTYNAIVVKDDSHTHAYQNITNEPWIEDSQESNLNVNSSNEASYWDDLDTPDDFENIIASGYIKGQPITGSIGSGIISSSDNIDNCGCINITTNSGLNIHYPDMVVRVVNTNGTVVHCDISGDDINVTNNAHSVYYVNSSCGITFSSFDTYCNADNSPGDYAQIFDIYTHDGTVEAIKGSTILELVNRKSRQIKIFCSSSSHLSVCNGLDLTINGFPEFNVSSGNIVYINTYLPVNGKSTLNDGLHYVYHEAGNWVHADGTGLNVTHCDDGTNLVECTGNSYRQYLVYNINWDVDTRIHQLAPLSSGNTYSTLAGCLEASPDYNLPSNEEHLAVVHHIYCAKRTDTVWNSDAWIDLRAEPVGAGGTPDLSIYLDVYGDKPLQSNWNQGAFNLTNTSSWFLGKTAWATIQNKFITAVDNVYIYMSGTTATLNETKLNSSIEAFGYIDSYTDTNASTACSGSTTYLDGEGNCDDISSVYRTDSWNNFTGIPTATPSDGDTTHLSTADQIRDYVIALSYITSLISDTTPQLGGYLDTAGQNIGSTSDEIENVYVATNSKIYFGDGQEAGIYYNSTHLIIG